MLKGGVLIFALVISLLVAMVAGCFILVAWHSSKTSEYWFRVNRIIRNVDSGIEILLSVENGFVSDTTIAMDLFDDGEDSVILMRKPWGAFEVISSEACFKDIRLKKSAIIGFSACRDTALALLVADSDRPLYLCGDTRLIGDCYVPSSGFKRAYIEGKSYQGSSFLEGRQLKSPVKIPEFKREFCESITDLIERGFNTGDSIVHVESSGIPDSCIRSFSLTGICFKSNSAIFLTEKFLKGNIIISSPTEIRVSKSCRIDGLILLAPKIIFEDNFRGTLQGFSTDSILIGKNVVFDYPSILGLFRTPLSGRDLGLILGDESEVSGALIGCEKSHTQGNKLILSLGRNSKVTGFVYSSDKVDLKGSVLGLVICSKLHLKTPSAIYDNHLHDAVIDRHSLPVFFGSLSFSNGSNHKLVLKWL